VNAPVSRRLNPAMALKPAPMSAKPCDPSEWVDRYGDALMQFACSRVGRREAAEDLVQETFLAAYQSRHEFDGRSAFSTWLIGILRRKVADYYRRNAKTLEVVDCELVRPAEPFDSRGKWTAAPAAWRTTPDRHAENAEFWEVVAGCLGGLPVHLAQVFEMRELGLASTDEVCQLTGLKPKNVAVRLHRARLLLRPCLERKWFRAEFGASS
jgi:RNA polymerase sigma-70 factor (ECF subfamily)